MYHLDLSEDEDLDDH